MQGQGKGGIAQIRQGMAVWQGMEAEEILPFFLALLAEAYGTQGQTEGGLTASTEALARVNKTGERFNEAEVWRIKGILTLESQVQSHKSKVEEAEEYFLKAIAIAQKQQAKSLELRAVMSLVRLRQQQATQLESCNTQHEIRAKLDEAHRTLSEVYNWFTEGFDTKDLQEAKALLDE
jgi:predicted ATPase